jgi:hypothetical protein
MVRIKGYGLLVSLACLLAFSACGGGNGGGGSTTTGRIGITLTVVPETLPADGVSTATITADVRTTRDNVAVADGTEVTFSLETTIGGTINPTAVTTTVAGLATAVVTAGNTVGTVTVKALSGTVSKTQTITITEVTSDNQAYSIVPSASPTQIHIFGQSMISAEIRDLDGNLAADGAEVIFSSALSGVSFENPYYTVGGIATATLTAGPTPGWASGVTITIEAGNTTDNSLKIQILDLTIPSLTLSDSAIAVKKDATVTAEVRDTQGNLAVDGTPVTFTTTLLGATFTPTPSVTIGGLADVKFTAGTYSGPAVITARVGNNAIASVTLTVGVSNVTISATATPATIHVGETSAVKAVVKSEGTAVPDGTPVTFSSDFTGAVITPQAETMSGVASATFTSGDMAGRATIRVKCGNTTINNLGITVVGQAASIAVSASPNPISVYASSSVRAEVRDSLGILVANGTTVTFSTTMAGATITESAETSNGLAFATFTAGESFGNGKVTVKSGPITDETLTLEILPPIVGSIEFGSATPLLVGVKGSGQPEVSTVIFKVWDSYGKAARDGTVVDFDLFGPKGGEYISPVTSVTLNGQATTHLQAGTVSGPVRIEASTISDNGTPTNLVDDFTLASASIGISIGAALPSWKNLSLSIANLGMNLAGLNCYGLTAGITAFLADRYFNFAVNGTSVNFFTEGGAISPYVVTNANGLAVATLQTQGPAPRDVGPGAFYQCGYNTCLHPCTPETSDIDLFYGPHQIYNPQDGVNTILVTAIGEESFDDINGNGIFDAGEHFVDLSEPYLDADDDGVYDYAEPITDGVDFFAPSLAITWPSKVNGRYDPPTPWVDVNLVDDDGDGNASECDGIQYSNADTTRDGNGTYQVIMNGTTLAHLPVIPGTLIIYDQTDPTNYLKDDGAGHISVPNAINWAYINYATGVITGTATFLNTILAGNSVMADYQAETTDCNNRWDNKKICLGELESPNAAVSCNPQVNPGCVCFPGEKFWDKWLPGQSHGDGMWNEAEFYVDYNNVGVHKGHFDGPNGTWDGETMIWTKITNLFTNSSRIRARLTRADSGCYAGQPAQVAIDATTSNYFVLDISDENFNPLDNLAFSITSKTSAACEAFPSNNKNVDPIGQAWTHFGITVSAPATYTPGPCRLEIKVTWSDTCGTYEQAIPLTGTGS